MTLFLFLNPIAELFCAATGQVRRKYLPPRFNLFIIQAWLAVAIDVAGIFSQKLFPGKSNHFLFNIYMPFDFLLLFLAAYPYIGSRPKLFNWLGIVTYFVVWTGSLFVQGINKMANFSIICGALILAIRYIQVLLWNARQPAGRVTTGIYLITVSILIYYCCVIPIFSLFHYFIRENLALAARIFELNSALSIFRYLGTGIGLLIASRAIRSNIAAHV